MVWYGITTFEKLIIIQNDVKIFFLVIYKRKYIIMLQYLEETKGHNIPICLLTCSRNNL